MSPGQWLLETGREGEVGSCGCLGGGGGERNEHMLSLKLLKSL